MALTIAGFIGASQGEVYAQSRNRSRPSRNSEIQNLRQQVTNLQDRVNAYESSEKKAKTDKEALENKNQEAIVEGEQVYKLTTSAAYTFPEYPWAITRFNEEEKKIEDVREVHFVSSSDGRFTDKIEELQKTAEVIGRFYRPLHKNPKAFEQLCETAGLTNTFSAKVGDSSTNYTKFDALAHLVSDFGRAERANPKNPLIISVYSSSDTNKADEVIIFGNYNVLRRVKEGKK